MVLYHIDRAGTLQPGKDITLCPLDTLSGNCRDSEFFREFPDGVSHHGSNYIRETCPYFQSINIGGIDFADIKSVFGRINTLNSSLMELTFELVRRSYFPKYPSRFQSLFAVKTIAEFEKWPELSDKVPNPQAQFFELDVPDSTPYFDANFVRGGLICGVEKSDTNINRYYIGHLLPSCFNLAYKYWSGEATENPRWEYLVRLPIPGTSVRTVHWEPEAAAFHRP